MSSATSTDAPGFRPWHFFVVVALAAATVAVMRSPRTAPEHLVMLSLTVFAAGAAGIAAYFLIVPLVSGDRGLRGRPLGEFTRAALENEKMLALRAIKELEFDRAMGKVSDEDFADMSLRLRARAVRVLQQLDETGAVQRERIARELDERLGARNATKTAGLKPGATETLKPGATETLKPGATETAGLKPGATEGAATPASDEAVGAPEADTGPRTCAACETENDRDARFCKQCGGRLQ